MSQCFYHHDSISNTFRNKHPQMSHLYQHCNRPSPAAAPTDTFGVAKVS